MGLTGARPQHFPKVVRWPSSRTFVDSKRMSSRNAVHYGHARRGGAIPQMNFEFGGAAQPRPWISLDRKGPARPSRTKEKQGNLEARKPRKEDGNCDG